MDLFGSIWGLAVLVFGSLGALVVFLIAVDLGMRRDRRKAKRETEREEA